MRNSVFPHFLLLSLALVLVSVACSRQDVCEEKMRALEGNYSLLGIPDPNPEGDISYPAQISKAGDHWVFSFTLSITPENGPKTTHQFEQRVSWSPELKAYLFEHLSDSDYELMRTDYVVTRINRFWITMLMKDQSETGINVVRQYTWEQQ